MPSIPSPSWSPPGFGEFRGVGAARRATSTCSDDCQALIWDLTALPKPVDDPILAYWRTRKSTSPVVDGAPGRVAICTTVQAFMYNARGAFVGRGARRWRGGRLAWGTPSRRSDKMQGLARSSAEISLYEVPHVARDRANKRAPAVSATPRRLDALSTA